MTHLALTYFIVAALVLGCAPQGEPVDTLPAPGAPQVDGLTGTVQVVGSAPVNTQVVLRSVGGESVRITGSLLPELERLRGVEVAVRGNLAPAPDPLVSRQIDVSEYEIVSIDGAPVVMGEIVSVEGGRVRLRTSSGEEVDLSSAPADFGVGQKVWVQGPRSVVVQSYGLIRP